jgi:hypothetical protein
LPPTGSCTRRPGVRESVLGVRRLLGAGPRGVRRRRVTPALRRVFISPGVK